MGLHADLWQLDLRDSESFGRVERWIEVHWMRDRPDFIARSIAPLVGWLGHLAGFYLRPSAHIRFVRAAAETIECVFLAACGPADQIGSVAVGTEGDQIAGMTHRTFDTMADAAVHECSEVHPLCQ